MWNSAVKDQILKNQAMTKVSQTWTLYSSLKTIKGGQAIFKQHIRETHQGIKNHKCDLCGASFSRPTGLRYHTQLVHENSGKYACSYCDFKTVIPKHLDIHVNSVHTKAIKYSCEDCNFSCYRKDGLTQHIKQVHLKLKRHHCTVCPEAYMRRSDFEKHKAITGHWILRYKCFHQFYETCIWIFQI